jgi:hypothetical protein
LASLLPLCRNAYFYRRKGTSKILHQFFDADIPLLQNRLQRLRLDLPGASARTDAGRFLQNDDVIPFA